LAGANSKAYAAAVMRNGKRAQSGRSKNSDAVRKLQRRYESAQTELREALAEQTATAEILRVMAASPGNPQPVFDAIARSAVRLCDASHCSLYQVEAGKQYPVAHHGLTQEMIEHLEQRYRRVPDPHTVTGHAILRREVVHVEDALADERFPESHATQRLAGDRVVVAVPMLQDAAPIGVLLVGRREARPFSARQIELLKTFADEAAIAIENVRLFKETSQTLERQTATAEILRVMAASPADVQPVFNAIAASAGRLCEASFCVVFRFDGRMITMAADDGRSPGTLDVIRAAYPAPPGSLSMSARAILERRVISIADAQNHPDAQLAERARRIGYRSILAVPMMKGETAIGAINVVRFEVNPFTEAQIGLLRTFADQAAIAIENVRLFNETREALERQTAAGEVLQAISNSAFDLRPVFDTIARNALHLGGAQSTTILRRKGDAFVVAANAGMFAERMSAEYREVRNAPGRGSVTGRVALERRTVQITDLFADAEYVDPKEEHAVSGGRSFLGVPILKGDEVLGVIIVRRAVPGPFEDKVVALLEGFAAQAAIAIENVRLFNETREALEQQKAIAEVLGVVTQLQSDVQPVFEAIGRNAAQLCSAMFSCVYRFDGELIHLVAIHNLPPAAQELARTMYPMKPDRSQLAGRAVLTCAIQRLEDVAQDGEYAKQVAVAGAWRRFLAVPMLREGKPLGVIGVGWPDPGAIPERQVELLKTFADQAVLAIEKVRLFNETREALEQQRALAEVLGRMSGSLADTTPVFDQILESCERLFEGHLVGMTLAGEDGLVRLGAYRGENKEALERIYPYPLGRDSGSGLAILERRVLHFANVGEAGSDAPPHVLRGAQAAGFKSIIFAPLVAEGRAIGALWVGRRVPGPFSARQTELLKSFADQAVIAIRNARLFNETKEALDQQKAAGDILRAISGSIADTAPVFDKILESCQRLFAGTIVGLNLVRKDGALHIGAYHGAHREEFEKIFPIPLTVESGSGLAILERRVVHYPDTQGADVPERTRKGCKTIGIQSAIFAPVLWEGRGLGAIFVGRDRLSFFSDQEISLLRTFADQAAIAIENAGLFREIEQKSRQLEVASRHKSEFLANMSHELRTPLNAIIGFTRIVMRRSKETLEPLQYENLDKILASGQQLLALINSILDLSKIEAGRVEVHPGRVGLAPLLEQCAHTIEPLVKSDAVTLVKDFNGALPEMFVDEEKLRQIVINLLSNAAKFTERGTIRLCAEAANGSVSIAVADTGIGIPEHKLDLIFEEFEQADASSTRAHGGTGLGLAIARRLARILGGDVEARSTPGAGSTFTLRLPVHYAG
jgi:GAF domain-containing protein/anti-sigma regulatory factor (Ser/Thr protein kinase)